MNGGLLLASDSARPLPLPTPPATREIVLRLLGVSPLESHLPLKRHYTGLDVEAVSGARKVKASVYVIARADAPEAERLRVLGLDVPAPALLVAQKKDGPDFSVWTSYSEPTGFLPIKADLRPLLERAQANVVPPHDPSARHYLAHLEAAARDLGRVAPKSPGVLRLVALDSHGNIAAASNFIPEDWRGLRNFALRAFDARQTCYAEGVLRAVVPHGSTAESVPVVEFVRWGDLPVGNPIFVKTGDKAVAFGQLLDKPVVFDSKKAPPRVPMAGLPIFSKDGKESRPVTWSTEE